MSGTAFDAILKNMSDVASIRMGTSQAKFNSTTQMNNARLAVLASMLQQRSGGNSNPSHSLAMAVMNQIAPKPAVADTIPQDSNSSGGSFLDNPVAKTLMGALPGGQFLGKIWQNELESKPGKWAMEQLARPSAGIGQAFHDQVYSGDKDYNLLDWFKSFGKGFGDTDHQLSMSDTLNDTVLKGLPGPVKFGAGLAADIFSDPTTYIAPESLVSKLKPASKIAKALEATDAAKVGEDVAKITPPSASDFLASVNPAAGKELVPFAKPRFAAGPGGIVSDSLNPVQFADSALANEISNSVLTAPRLANPDLHIDPLFHNVEKVETHRVPKQITEEVEVPINEKTIASAAKSTAAASGSNSKLAALRAVKMHLLQASDYKIHGFTVGQLLDAAKNTPERASEIEKLINGEAKKIYQSGDFSDLPKVAQLRGRSGNPAAFGLTLKQATQLFEHGKVAKALQSYSEKTDNLTHDFPIHDPEDLKNVHLKNAKGETVSLESYLTDLGIPVRSVDPSGVETALNKVAPKEEPFSFDFEKAPTTKKVKQTRTVYEEVHQTTTSTRKASRAEQLKWQIAHSDRLSPKEIEYLRSARTAKQFDTRVAELRTKTVTGDIKTLRDFVDAAKAGVIPKEYLDELFKRVGVSGIDQLEKRATAIIKKTGASAKKFVDKELAPGIVERSRIPEKTPIGKFERTKGKPQGEDPWASVPTPSQLIDAAGTDGPAVLMKDLPEVTDTSLRDLAAALPESIVKNLVDPQDVAKYPFLSGKVAAKRTHQQMGVGKGRNLKGWNKYSQYDMWKSIVGSASKRNYTTGLQGKELAARLKVRPGIMYNEVMSSMKLGEAALKKAGVKFIAGDQNSGLMLSLVDVLDSLDRKLVEKVLFTTGKGIKRIDPTAVLDSAERMVFAKIHGGNLDLAKEAARNIAKRTLTEKGADEFVKGLESALPKIITNVNKNYAQHSIEIGTAVQSMSEQVIDNIIKKFTDPSVSVGDAFSEIINRSSAIHSAGTALKAPSEAAGVAKVIVDTELAHAGVQPGDLAEAATTKKIVSANTSADVRKAGVAQQKSREAEAMTLGEAAGESVEDLGDYFATTQAAGIYRANVPLLDKVQTVTEAFSKAFLPGYGFPDLHTALWRDKNVALTFARNHRALMSQTAKMAGQLWGKDAATKTQEAWSLLQQGAVVEDQAMNQVMSAMQHSIDVLWAGGKHGEGAFAVRNGFFVEHLNSLMDYYGVPKHMRFDVDKSLQDQKDIWKSWTDVKDPLDSLDRVHAAYQAATVDVTIARNFSTQFGSAIAKDGFVKLSDKSSKSTLFKYIDQDLYYPREVAAQIPYYDNIRNLSYKGIDNPNLRAMVRIFDKAQQAMKTGWTVLRPGHHVSNLLGDMTLNFLAKVDNPLSYYKAIRVLKSRASLYRDWDGQKALMEGVGIPESIKKGGTVKAARKFTVSDDEVWRGAYKQGILPEFHDIQDITFNEAQNFNKLYDASKFKNAGKKILHAAGKTADAESHFTRMAQFIHVLERSGASTLAEAFDEAGAAVRKWHPDGTDLTPFERKVMRRAIPFYSWLRKSTPLVIQSLILQPGRSLVIPKALNQFAQVMGMDPNSIADPFPQESLLPSWLTDNIVGPQWTGSLMGNLLFGSQEGHKYGFSLPGDPVSGTVDGIANNPIGSLLNSITPFAKAPIELASGHSLATGSEIKNPSEYLDQQIPLLSVASNITNTDPLGGFKPQSDVPTGQQPGMDMEALSNFLFGMGVKDYSKPSYQKAGVAELRQQYKNRVFGGR